MIRTHKNKNDDHNNLSSSLRKNLCRLHNFPFTTNYNYAKPKNHYEVTNNRPDRAFNRLVEIFNCLVVPYKHLVRTIKNLVKAINHLVGAIKYLVEPFNHLVEAIKYNLLRINTLQSFLKAITKRNNNYYKQFSIQFY